jgi:Response regulator containing CheY-like receiver, AAA-type ATPase, and DNA-binding domains
MVDSLDVIIVDDDPVVCDVISMMIKLFYTWGQVYAFTKTEEAVSFCRRRKSSVAIFVLDVFLEDETGFGFLEAIVDKYPLAYQDTIIITGNVSDDVVNMCVASNITYLVEKPIRPYTLQLAVRAIVAKYLKFAKKILQDPGLADSVSAF